MFRYIEDDKNMVADVFEYKVKNVSIEEELRKLESYLVELDKDNILYKINIKTTRDEFACSVMIYCIEEEYDINKKKVEEWLKKAEYELKNIC